MDRAQRMGVLLILLSVTGYSFLPVFTKNLYAENVAPPDIALWRFAIAAPVLWAITLLRGVRLMPGGKRLPHLRVMAMGGLMAAAALTAFFGLQYLPAATLVVLFYTYPAMVALLGLLLGERLPLLAWGAIGLTLIGVVLTAPDFTSGLEGGNAIGVMLALLNALIIAVYYIVSSRLLRGYPDMARATAWTLLGGLVVLIAISLVNGFALPQSPRAWLLLVGLAVICTIMPVFALNLGIQKLGAARAAIIGTVEPILTGVLALIFLGEGIQVQQVIGGAVIIASVLLLELRPMLLRKSLTIIGAGD